MAPGCAVFAGCVPVNPPAVVEPKPAAWAPGAPEASAPAPAGWPNPPAGRTVRVGIEKPVGPPAGAAAPKPPAPGMGGGTAPGGAGTPPPAPPFAPSLSKVSVTTLPELFILTLPATGS